jgi:bifunctional non-homologous end joining protein LigD
MRYIEPVLHSSAFIPPCEPTLRDRLPKGEGWLYELASEGHRIQLHKAGDRITLYTGTGADCTSHLPHLAAGLIALPCVSAIIDAELVHMDGFGELHRRADSSVEDRLLLSTFDLMQLNGNDLRAVFLQDRKRRLGHIVELAKIDRLRHSQTFSNGEGLLAECGKRGFQGVVAKHKAGIYRSGRSTSWIEVKCPAWRDASRRRDERFGEGGTAS